MEHKDPFWHYKLHGRSAAELQDSSSPHHHPCFGMRRHGEVLQPAAIVNHGEALRADYYGPAFLLRHKGEWAFEVKSMAGRQYEWHVCTLFSATSGQRWDVSKCSLCECRAMCGLNQDASKFSIELSSKNFTKIFVFSLVFIIVYTIWVFIYFCFIFID